MFKVFKLDQTVLMKESDEAWAFNKIKQFLKSIKLSVQLWIKVELTQGKLL